MRVCETLLRRICHTALRQGRNTRETETSHLFAPREPGPVIATRPERMFKVQYWIGNRSPIRSPLCGALISLASLRLALHEPFRLTQYGVRPAKEQRHHARGRPGRERCPPHLLDLAVLHRRDQLRERPVDCRDQPAHVRGVDSAAEHLSAQGRTPDSLKAEGAEERWEGWRRGGRDRPSEGELPSGRA